MNKENVIQGAIIAALEVYCDRHDLHTDAFEPYANQQGVGPNQFIADVLMRIAHSKLLLLEVKELDAPSRVLPAYDPLQHYLDWQMESVGVPILYGYAAVEHLPYLQSLRGREWPQKTLLNIKISVPSELLPIGWSGLPATPDTPSHSNLLVWLLSEPPLTNSLAAIAALLNFASFNMRNNKLLILCAGGGAMQALSATSAVAIIRQFLDDPPGSALDAAVQPSFYAETLQGLRSRIQDAIEAQYTQLEETRRREIEDPVDEVMRNQNIYESIPEEISKRRKHERLKAARMVIIERLSSRRGPDSRV